MKKRVLIVVAFMLSITMILAACGGGGGGSSTPAPAPATPAPAPADAAPADDPDKPDSPIKLVIAHGLNETNPCAILCLDFKDYLDTTYPGWFDVEIYPLGQLGSEREIIESCQEGSIQVVSCSTSPFTGFTLDAGIFNIPWAIQSNDELLAVLADDEFIGAFNKFFDGIGLRIALLAPAAFRGFESARPVRTLEDFQGLKMRVMTIDAHIATWNALGCSTYQLPFSELSTALEQGLADAHDSNFSLAIANSLYSEKVKYFTVINQLPGVVPYVMNADWFNGLTPKQQDVVMEAWDVAYGMYPDMVKVEEQAAYDMAEEVGGEVFVLSAEDIAKGAELVKPAWDIVKAEVSPELYDAYFKAIEKARG